VRVRARLAIGVAALAFAASTAAQPLEVIVFPGGFNWPLWVGIEKSFFPADMEVKLTPTPNSVFQVQGLMAGKFDIGFSTIDNVIAYDEGQGEAPLPEAADFFSFMGAQYGAVRLVAQPGIESIPQLKGKSLAVDAATTGYAFVLKKLLQKNGLGEGDYTLERLGGTAERAQALMQGKTAATILTSPLEVTPEANGYKRLANAVDAIGPYQAVVGMARRSWARNNESRLIAFIGGYVKALDWLRDPAHRTEAVAIYRKYLPQAPEAAAQKAWEVLLTSGEGFQPKAKLDREGIRTVLALRSEFGTPRKSLDDPDKYIDESYYRKALQ
jgi:ABC-type nitrate/sulfonate/bicarbonate transport system substrate-binding protein